MKAMFKKVVDCEIEKTAHEAAKKQLRSLEYSRNEDEYQRCLLKQIKISKNTSLRVGMTAMKCG